MTMAEEKQTYIVGGIAFHDVESAKIAQNELRRIELLDEKMNYGDVESVAAVYDKARKNHIFKTPIGISYMMRLQNCLVQNRYPGISDMPIFVQTEYGQQNGEEKEQDKKGQNHSEGLWKARLENSREETKKQREKLRLSVGLNLLLAVLVITLFIISQTGNNPTILNYRSKIIDQYAQWQQQLEEREQAIEEKEAELGIK